MSWSSRTYCSDMILNLKSSPGQATSIAIYWKSNAWTAIQHGERASAANTSFSLKHSVLTSQIRIQKTLAQESFHIPVTTWLWLLSSKGWTQMISHSSTVPAANTLITCLEIPTILWMITIYTALRVGATCSVKLWRRRPVA